MYAHCLGSQAVQLLPVKLGRTTVVLLLGVLRTNEFNAKVKFLGVFSHLGIAVVTAEEGEGLGIATQLHLTKLLPSPVRV